ncbi:MAG TPA: Rieske 2Fe-2S domain-containing protein [Polyangium sp.]|nr:Rieske 2Fe-2S domain-containing protein [Polyangium sp.]
MAVVTFDPGHEHFVIAGSLRFFLSTTDGRVFHLLRAACPHRGGPLHLGRLDTDKGTIRCPWHDGDVSLRCLQRDAAPLVVRPGSATAILPDPDDDSITVDGRLVLATRR